MSIVVSTTATPDTLAPGQRVTVAWTGVPDGYDGSDLAASLSFVLTGAAGYESYMRADSTSQGDEDGSATVVVPQSAPDGVASIEVRSFDTGDVLGTADITVDKTSIAGLPNGPMSIFSYDPVKPVLGQQVIVGVSHLTGAIYGTDWQFFVVVNGDEYLVYPDAIEGDYATFTLPEVDGAHSGQSAFFQLKDRQNYMVFNVAGIVLGGVADDDGDGGGGSMPPSADNPLGSVAYNGLAFSLVTHPWGRYDQPKTYVDNGRTFIFMGGITGMGLPPLELTAEAAPGVDGSLLKAVSSKERDIFIPIYMRASTPELLRAKVSELMNAISPLQGNSGSRNDVSVVNGRRYSSVEVQVWTAATGVRTCYCEYVSGLEGEEGTDSSKNPYWRTFGLVLRAFDPWWYADDATEVTFSLTTTDNDDTVPFGQPGYAYPSGEFIGPDFAHQAIEDAAKPGGFAVPEQSEARVVSYQEGGNTVRPYYRMFPVSRWKHLTTSADPDPTPTLDPAWTVTEDGATGSGEWTKTVYSDDASFNVKLIYGDPAYVNLLREETYYTDGRHIVYDVNAHHGWSYAADGTPTEIKSATDTWRKVNSSDGEPMTVMHYFRTSSPYSLATSGYSNSLSFYLNDVRPYEVSNKGKPSAEAALAQGFPDITVDGATYGTDTNNDYLPDSGDTTQLVGINTTVTLGAIPSGVAVWPNFFLTGPASNVHINLVSGTDFRTNGNIPADRTLRIVTAPHMRLVSLSSSVDSDTDSDPLGAARLAKNGRFAPLLPGPTSGHPDGDQLTITATNATADTALTMSYQKGFKTAW